MKTPCSGAQVQPFIRAIRFLWHDLQLMIKGEASQKLYLHFLQRLEHALTSNSPKTRSKSLTVPMKDVKTCTTVHPPLPDNNVKMFEAEVKLLRTWKGVFDT